MCLIVTVIMLVLAIQNLIAGYYNMGALQLVIALGFAFLLWRNIQLTRCERSGNCSGCTLPKWLGRLLGKEEKK